MNLSLDHWMAIVSSVLGGLVGGLFTYIGVKANLADGWRKESIEREKMRKEKILIIKSNRPELEIIKVKNEQSKNTEVSFVPFINYVVTEQDFKSVFEKDIFSNLRESITIKLYNIGKTDIDELILNIQDVENTILLGDVDCAKTDIEKGYVNFSKTLDTYLKTEQSTFITINFYGNCKNGVLYILFKDINGFYWKQKFIINYCNSNKIRATVPQMISPYEYRATQSSEELINYILYKSYNNYENDTRFEYQGVKDFLVDEKFDKYKKERDELTDKKINFDKQYNFQDFNLYD